MKINTYKGRLSRRREIGIHLMFWILLFYFKVLQFDRSHTFHFTIRDVSIFDMSWYLVYSLTFYFNYLIVVPKVLSRIYWKSLVLGFLSSYMFFVGFRYFIEENIFLLMFNQTNYVENTSFLFYLYDNLYFSTYPLIPSTLLWLLIFTIRQKDYNAFISEEKKTIEIQFLKSQLNPHFIFNTLNNIYSLVHFKSEKALPAIEKLSSIMRYTTYESQKEKITLEDEISQIESFIELEQIRRENPLNLEFRKEVENKTLKLPPLILFPFVENAIKHGVFDKTHPLKINLSYQKQRLQFTVINRIRTHEGDASRGIGIQNLKKRLDIYYPKTHVLDLNKINGFYRAYLELQF